MFINNANLSKGTLGNPKTEGILFEIPKINPILLALWFLMMRVVAAATMLVDYLQAVSKEDGKYSESVHELPAAIHSEVDQRHQ
jgi:hypothetical protein